MLEAYGLNYAKVQFSGGGETQIQFEIKRYRYIIYDSLVRTGFGPDGHNDSKITTGLLVLKSNRTIANLLCNGTIMSSRVSSYLPETEVVRHIRGKLFKLTP